MKLFKLIKFYFISLLKACNTLCTFFFNFVKKLLNFLKAFIPFSIVVITKENSENVTYKQSFRYKLYRCVIKFEKFIIKLFKLLKFCRMFLLEVCIALCTFIFSVVKMFFKILRSFIPFSLVVITKEDSEKSDVNNKKNSNK